MKKLFIAMFSALLIAATPLCFTACSNPSGKAVNLVAVNATEVGVRSDVDYYVVPEPAASTKVNAIASLDFAGDLQTLYGSEKGYPQAVVVAKTEIANHYFSQCFAAKLKENATWLLDESTTAESIVDIVSGHLNGMTPTFSARNLSKNVIKNCSVNFVDAWECKEEVVSFMEKFNAVSDTSFGSPSDSFFVEEVNYGADEYAGKISVYAPDGAPALGLAKLMMSDDKPINGAEMSYDIVDASTIQVYVTGESPKADICVLPVNLAVKLLGSGKKYKMLGTLTHGNLFIVSNGGQTITKENLSSLKGKTVGVVNLAQVPGLTFKTILKDNGIEYEELV